MDACSEDLRLGRQYEFYRNPQPARRPGRGEGHHDLHLYDGYIPTMEKGDIVGHEFMGEVAELGPKVENLKPGDRVVVPSIIGCGDCFFCRRGLWTLCDNTNPDTWMAEKLWGQSPCGIFGYSHLTGGYAGSHAEYIRVPFADVRPRKVPENLSDEQALFISDAFPTGFMGADFCDIQLGATVMLWGCGAVGQFAIKSACLPGAERFIAINQYQERLKVAREFGGTEVLNYAKEENLVEALKQMTGGCGSDACVDAVGLEAHKAGVEGAFDCLKQAVRLDRTGHTCCAR